MYTVLVVWDDGTLNVLHDIETEERAREICLEWLDINGKEIRYADYFIQKGDSK